VHTTTSVRTALLTARNTLNWTYDKPAFIA